MCWLAFVYRQIPPPAPEPWTRSNSMDATSHRAELSLSKSLVYASGYLALCMALSVPPFMWAMQQRPARPISTVVLGAENSAVQASNDHKWTYTAYAASVIAVLIVVGIFCSGLVLAWKVHRSRRLLGLFILFGLPAGYLTGVVAAVLLYMGGVGGFSGGK